MCDPRSRPPHRNQALSALQAPTDVPRLSLAAGPTLPPADDVKPLLSEIRRLTTYRETPRRRVIIAMPLPAAICVATVRPGISADRVYPGSVAGLSSWGSVRFAF
ncbi:uncharacterized protein CC84DRAFT_857470 [Paraphaeosphaeria sporulosa]|uniref:Uncharacterized protein n=1 Tax=Paraphaeosphaeria sporulosa TaxID=1460663 RepID=A0A177C8S7_9PLEO|nr:uncharacterized protein CC84DRAFT_857470 [Paraphaeosphaeria sporulosa]OAG03531.1 hypothetical protein CC84DRAFT_857470 [Paraphaeosphaeria sporulosa]